MRRLADRRVVHVQVAADGPTTTSPEFRPTRIWIGTPSVAPDSVGVALHRLLHPQRGVAGAHRVVLVRQRRAEQRHDAVAHHLVDGALVAVHRLHHALEHRVEELARLLRIAVGEQLHRALQVGEQHRDLLALAFERAFGGEDLLGEMLGGVRIGRREARLDSWLSSHCLPALKTKLRAGGKLRAALNAVECKTSSALQAELAPDGFSCWHCAQRITQLLQFRFRSFKPQSHLHLPHHRNAVGELRLSLFVIAGAPI